MKKGFGNYRIDHLMGVNGVNGVNGVRRGGVGWGLGGGLVGVM